MTMRSRRKPAIQRDHIIDAALGLLERVGADGITMRGLAAELHIQAPSLYWHFESKQALFEAMADRMIAGLAQKLRLGEAWDDVLADFGRQVRQALLCYRDGARIFAGTYPVTENVMRIGDTVIGALVAGGYSSSEATWAMFTVNYYVIGFVLEEQVIHHGGTVDGRRELPAIADEIASHASQHPMTVAALPAMLDEDFDSRFEYGLDAIVSGLRLRLASGDVPSGKSSVKSGR